MKIKRYILISVLVILCIILYVIFAKPAIETYTWELYLVQQAEPFSVVAHSPVYDFSDDKSNLLAFSKEIELVLVAKEGKLILTDKTNDRVYEGTYKTTSWSRFSGQNYAVVIEGNEGTANITSGFNRALFVSVGGYYLNFKNK